MSSDRKNYYNLLQLSRNFAQHHTCETSGSTAGEVMGSPQSLAFIPNLTAMHPTVVDILKVVGRLTERHCHP